MNTLHKRFAIIFTAAAIGLASFAWAGPGDGYGCGYGGMRGDPEQRRAMMQERRAERLALMQEKLNLTAEQQPAWQAFEAAQQAHFATRGQGRSQAPTEQSVPDFFAERAQLMEQRLTTLQGVANAANSLYAVLTPEQQAIMNEHFAQRGPRWGRR